jgi:hypothetical protein
LLLRLSVVETDSSVQLTSFPVWLPAGVEVEQGGL